MNDELPKPKLCINCIYSLSDYYAQGAYQCTHEKNLGKVSLVTGRQGYLFSAEQLRYLNLVATDACGESADWWVEKAKVYYDPGHTYNPRMPVQTGETAEERMTRLKTMLAGKSKKLSHTTVEDLI